VSQDGPAGHRERIPAPPSREANDTRATAVITTGWAVALIVLICLRSELPLGTRWWIWTCIAGLGLGFFGLVYVPFLKRRRARLAAAHAAHHPQAQLSASGSVVSESPVPSAGPVSSDSVSRDRGSNTVSSTETPGKSTMS
jgi:hypothetical protein